MNEREALTLLRPAVEATDATWADLGAGTGTFTGVLANLLGPGGTVLAIDRDPAMVDALERMASAPAANRARIVPATADVRDLPPLPPLDGVLLANVLHFVPRQEQRGVLEAVSRLLSPPGRVVVIEYEDREVSRWVPHPVSSARLAGLARAANLSAPSVLGTVLSMHGGTLYAAVLRPG